MPPLANDPVQANDGQQDDRAQGDIHADKYNDPRVKITPRGIAMGIGVLLLGILGAATSIYARRTHLEQTTRFWGLETITALQLAERIELRPRGTADFKTVDLTGTPGLGHLRRLLLDERNYDWTSEGAGNALEHCGETKTERPQCIQLRLTDPTAHRFGTIEIDLDLVEGWIGPSDGTHRIRDDGKSAAEVGQLLRNHHPVRAKELRFSRLARAEWVVRPRGPGVRSRRIGYNRVSSRVPMARLEDSRQCTPRLLDSSSEDSFDLSPRRNRLTQNRRALRIIERVLSSNARSDRDLSPPRIAPQTVSRSASASFLCQ